MKSCSSIPGSAANGLRRAQRAGGNGRPARSIRANKGRQGATISGRAQGPIGRAICRSRGVTLIELLLGLALMLILTAIAVPVYQNVIGKSEERDVVAELRELEAKLERFKNQNFDYPDSLSELPSGVPLDPWGNPYQYLNIANVKGKGKLRKDKNLVPINSDYDLYSMGPDGKSVSPLTAKPSRDDIIRANNGGFFGVAIEY